MKIIVNSEREKEIIEQFTDFLADWIYDEKMGELLKQDGHDDFKPHELDLIQEAFHQVNPKVDEKEYPIYLQSDDLSGECKYCGGQWRGIEDMSVVTVDEYERNLNLPKEEGYHAECYREITCALCGNDEAMSTDDLFENEKWGPLCESCHNKEKIKEESE